MAFFKICFVMYVFLLSQSAIAGDMLTCPPGYYISDDTCVRAPSGTVSPGGTATKYTECIWTTYANADQSECVSCPPEYPYSSYGNASINSCFRICMGGTYMARVTDTECTTVGVNYWAPMHVYYYGNNATTDDTLHLCPPGTRTLGTIGYGADDATDCAPALHVGNYTLRMVGKKKTSPALAVLFNGATYWAQMSTVSTPMNNMVTGMLRTSVDDTEYWVHDDTIATRAPYPWESPDYDWGEVGHHTYDFATNTWTIKFTNSTWSGLSRCIGDTCECKMMAPAVSEWLHRSIYSNCEQRCAHECSWAYANGPRYKQMIISAVPE